MRLKFNSRTKVRSQHTTKKTENNEKRNDEDEVDERNTMSVSG